MLSSKTSVVGSQPASKVVPVTFTSNGPARTAHRVSRPWWWTSACTVPRSMSRPAPLAEISVTRIRAPGARVTRVPSEKRTPSGASCSAATQSPTAPATGGAPTSNERAAPSRRTSTTATSARQAAAASATRIERRAPRRAGLEADARNRRRAAASADGSALASETSRTAAPSSWMRSLSLSIGPPAPATA